MADDLRVHVPMTENEVRALISDEDPEFKLLSSDVQDDIVRNFTAIWNESL